MVKGCGRGTAVGAGTGSAADTGKEGEQWPACWPDGKGAEGAHTVCLQVSQDPVLLNSRHGGGGGPVKPVTHRTASGQTRRRVSETQGRFIPHEADSGERIRFRGCSTNTTDPAAQATGTGARGGKAGGPGVSGPGPPEASLLAGRPPSSQCPHVAVALCLSLSSSLLLRDTRPVGSELL